MSHLNETLLTSLHPCICHINRKRKGVGSLWGIGSHEVADIGIVEGTCQKRANVLSSTYSPHGCGSRLTFLAVNPPLALELDSTQDGNEMIES